MRSMMTWALALGVALLVADTASAQQQRRQGQGQGRGFGGGMMQMGVAQLLTNEGVQKELKLTDEQKEKAKEFSDAQREKMREAFGGGQPDREKMQELMKASTEAGEKFIKDNLKPEQQTRLHQIQLQARLQMGGPQAFTDEKVAKELKLTDEQKEKLKTLADDLGKDRRELMQGGFNQETMQKMQALTKEYTTKATDVLTADQKKAWKDMTGEPFTVQMQRRRQGGDR
jgi:Spy/CpxP family protein refolding chaperone